MNQKHVDYISLKTHRGLKIKEGKKSLGPHAFQFSLNPKAFENSSRKVAGPECILDFKGFCKFEKCWIVKVSSLKHLRCKVVFYHFFPLNAQVFREAGIDYFIL